MTTRRGPAPPRATPPGKLADTIQRRVWGIACRRLASRSAGIALLALLALAASAHAAGRFAIPAGRGTACTRSSPCDIVTAVNDASRGDDITVEPGTYGAGAPLATTLDDAGNALTIHGEAGRPRPLVLSSAAFGLELSGHGTRVSDLELRDDSSRAYGVYVASDAPVSIDHVIVRVSGAGATACYASGSIADSVCWSRGVDGVGVTLLLLASASVELRNDTVIASGAGGVALAADAMLGATTKISLTNTIARGAQSDIRASTDPNASSKAIVTAEHSDYATVQLANGGAGSTTSVTRPGSATNQVLAPVFVNAGAGDFRERQSSLATVDEGIDSPLDGATDLDGNPRRLGAHTDIGAYELLPRPVASHFSQSHRVWRESRAAKGHAPVGTTFSFALNELATARLSFFQRLPGRALGGRCVAETERNRHRRPCTRTLARGAVSFAARAGLSRLFFRGRVSRSVRLASGSYTVVLIATNAEGRRSRAARLTFTIVGPAK